MYLSAYTGKDRFYVGEKETNGGYDSQSDMRLDWGNITSALRWNHLFNSQLFSNTTLTFSRYLFDTFFKFEDQLPYGKDEIRFRYYSGIEDYGAKMDFDYLPNPNHYVRFGLNHTYHTFSPGSMDIYIYEIDSVLTDSSFNFSEKLYAHDPFYTRG